MKQYLFFAASAAMMLASCSSEQVDFTQESLQAQKDGPAAVQFSTYLSKAGTTRAGTAGVITTDALKTGTHKDDGFGVFGYYTQGAEFGASATPNFMYNQQVKWDGTNSKWTYSPVKYWPNETINDSQTGNGAVADNTSSYDRLSFFAYAPYVSAGSGSIGITGLSANTATGAPVITYMVDQTADASSCVDLLWGVAESNVTWGTVAKNGDAQVTVSVEAGKPWLNLIKPAVNQNVIFYFKHALAQLLRTISAVTDEKTPAENG